MKTITLLVIALIGLLGCMPNVNRQPEIRDGSSAISHVQTDMATQVFPDPQSIKSQQASQAGITKPQLSEKPSSPKISGTPLSINLDAEKLPIRYRGDSALLPKLFDKLNKSSKKDEYESSNDYIKRLESEIDDKIYAFMEESSGDNVLNKVEYNADNQTLFVTVGMLHSKPASVMLNMNYEELTSFEGYARVEISKIYHNMSDYIGSNAFGHSVKVSRAMFEGHGLAIANKIKKEVLGKLISIKMPPYEARAIGKNVGMVFICKLHKPGPRELLAYDDYTTVKPTINNPYDIVSVHHLIMVDLYQIWIYDKITGRIITKDILM